MTENEAPAPSPRPRPRRGRTVVSVLTILTVLCAAAAAYLGVRVQQQAGLADARAAATDAGHRYAIELSSYDYRDLNAAFAAVTRDATTAFAASYRTISGNAGPLLRQEHSTATATVLAEGVQSATTDRAVLVVFVDQSVTNSSSPQPQVSHNRMLLTLADVSGTWKIDGVQLR